MIVQAAMEFAGQGQHLVSLCKSLGWAERCALATLVPPKLFEEGGATHTCDRLVAHESNRSSRNRARQT